MPRYNSEALMSKSPEKIGTRFSLNQSFESLIKQGYLQALWVKYRQDCK